MVTFRVYSGSYITHVRDCILSSHIQRIRERIHITVGFRIIKQ